jgi:transcriptional regulator with PAS, ATPase and Fis domain
VITIHLPPLRERAEDIALLAFHFLTQYAEKSGKRVFSRVIHTVQIVVDELTLMLSSKNKAPEFVRGKQNVVMFVGL